MEIEVFRMKKRIHFIKKENIIVEKSDERCAVCKERKISIYQKGWIFRKHLGNYCNNPFCVRGKKNFWLEEIVKKSSEKP